MRLLLDTQALIWYVDQDHLLSQPAHAAITDPQNDLLLSAASIWEIAIKVGIGKLKLSLPFKPWITKAISDLGLNALPITIDYADARHLFPSTTATHSIGSSSRRLWSKRFQSWATTFNSMPTA
jgi:PIN domain nuclease of toxin-antitoxin system